MNKFARFGSITFEIGELPNFEVFLPALSINIYQNSKKNVKGSILGI